jgi:NTE family protein
MRLLFAGLLASLALTLAGPVGVEAAPHGEALVLCGGGATGTAWETGILLGLQRAGLDPTNVDVVIGTSAGSIVGAQMRSGTPLEAMFAAQKAAGNGLAAWAKGLDPAVLGATSALYAHQPLTQAQRADVGTHALATQLPDEATWLQTFVPQSGIASITRWPAQPLKMVTVDASDGAIRVFDAQSGAPIQRVIAASAAVPSFTPPITIDGRRYIDGGVAGTNIDLAAGSLLILAIVPHPAALVASDVAALRAQGSTVVTIFPDDASVAAIGPNSLDASRKAVAADAGLSQGLALATTLRTTIHALHESH